MAPTIAVSCVTRMGRDSLRLRNRPNQRVLHGRLRGPDRDLWYKDHSAAGPGGPKALHKKGRTTSQEMTARVAGRCSNIVNRGEGCNRLDSRPFGCNLMSAQILREPRWPAFVAMLAAAGVYLALPEPLSVGPSWLLLTIILLLMIPMVVSDRRGNHNVTRTLTFIANGIITIAMIASLIHLIQGIPQHLETPKALLRSASALWIANILVFALWYWKLDGGGPLKRERAREQLNSSFLFPQMLSRDGRDTSWTPHFVDYLFLAFNTSTAFSPTDTAVLSRWAKLGTMLQSLISLMILALLAARAVNIL